MMTPLNPVERKRLELDLADASESVLKIVQPLSELQLTFRPRHDRWSIAENIEHLSIVDHLVLGQILEVVRTRGPVKESSWAGRDEAFLERVRHAEPPIKAPDIIAPSGKVDPSESVVQFRFGCLQLSEFAKTTEAPLRSYCFPHPVFGELDCYQWLLGAAAHHERHRTQILGVMAAPDFPVLRHGVSEFALGERS